MREAAYRKLFRIEDLEHAIELRDSQQVFGLFCDVQQLHRATASMERQILGRNHPDSSAVYAHDIPQIKNDIDATSPRQSVNVIAEQSVPFLEDQVAREREDRDIGDAAFGDLQDRCHKTPACQRKYLMNITSFRASL